MQKMDDYRIEKTAYVIEKTAYFISLPANFNRVCHLFYSIMPPFLVSLSPTKRVIFFSQHSYCILALFFLAIFSYCINPSTWHTFLPKPPCECQNDAQTRWHRSLSILS